MADGTPIDMILTPLGVPSRMNLGQILELHLGAAAKNLNYQAVVPPFAGSTDQEIKEELKKAGLSEDGKVQLYDGRTGEAIKQKTAVGYMYMLKLDHMVEDKIHMRSIGPTLSLPSNLWVVKLKVEDKDLEKWKFGHSLSWYLYTLREMLTVKSDDIIGRSATFDAIVRMKNTVENLPMHLMY